MSSNDLYERIEANRGKMIEVGMSKGFTSPDTIKLSQLLDKLINLEMNS